MSPNPHHGPTHRVRAKVRCQSGHQHELCVTVPREVHPDLRCAPDDSAGYVTSGGGGCRLPADLQTLVERELREHYQESRRRGWVEVAA
jgi:hypothetical protein